MSGTSLLLAFGLSVVGGYWVKGMWCDKKCQNNNNGR